MFFSSRHFGMRHALQMRTAGLKLNPGWRTIYENWNRCYSKRCLRFRLLPGGERTEKRWDVPPMSQMFESDDLGLRCGFFRDEKQEDGLNLPSLMACGSPSSKRADPLSEARCRVVES